MWQLWMETWETSDMIRQIRSVRQNHKTRIERERGERERCWRSPYEGEILIKSILGNAGSARSCLRLSCCSQQTGNIGLIFPFRPTAQLLVTLGYSMHETCLSKSCPSDPLYCGLWLSLANMGEFQFFAKRNCLCIIAIAKESRIKRACCIMPSAAVGKLLVLAYQTHQVYAFYF